MALAIVPCGPPAQAATTARVVPRLTLDSASSDVFRVDITVTATRVGDLGCNRADVVLTLEGPTPRIGTGLVSHIRATLPAELHANALYGYASVPQMVIAKGSAQCNGLPPHSPLETTQLSVQIPAAVAQKPPPPTPKPDGADPPKNEGIRGNVEAAGDHFVAQGAISCTAGVIAVVASRGGAFPLLQSTCGASAIGAAGAGAFLAVDPPVADYGRPYPVDVSPASFRPKRPLLRCNRARRVLRLRVCRAIVRAAARYVADEREIAWLVRAIAVSENRKTAARSAPLDVVARARLVALHNAAQRIFAARVTRLYSDSLQNHGEALARRLRGTRLDRAITSRLWRTALVRFRRGRWLRKSVRRSLARDGIDAMRSLRYMARTVAPTRRSRGSRRGPALATSVSALFDAPQPSMLHSAEDVLEGLQPSAATQLLGAWGVNQAAQLEPLCGEQYQRRFNSLVRKPGVPHDSYAAVLLKEFVRDRLDTPVAPECISGPTPPPLIQARQDIDPGPWQVVVPRLDAPEDFLVSAWDVHVSSSAEMLVTDSGAATVRRYRPDGALEGLVGRPGDGDGTLASPFGVTADPSGRIYVTDFDRNRVSRFGPAGTFELGWGTQGSGPGQLFRPAGIAYSPVTGQIIVVDARNNRLQMFDPNGAVLGTTLPGSPSDAAYLYRPRGLAVAADGTIAVANTEAADGGPGRVVLFRPDGRLIGATGPAAGLENPYDVAFDAAGHLWVADRDGGALKRLAGLAAVDRTVKALGPEPALAIAPNALAFTATSELILDAASQRVLRIPAR